MIKEKQEKNSDSTKDEAGSSDKETASTEVRIKKEDEAGIKKETTVGPITKNGGIVGSTNTGSMQTTIDRKGDGHTEDSVSVPVTDSNTLSLKQEESIDNELGSDAFGLGLPTTGDGTHTAPPEGVQPLTSNVINKQPNSMEVQYMQQQSQIFVFSTMLANSGADEVLQRRYPSIIAYHCAQPGTKKYLEKNPLKVTQFNRQNPAQWLNNLAVMKNKSCTQSPGLGPKATPLENFLGPDSLDDMVGLEDANISWNQKNNHHLEGLDAAVTNGLPDVVPDMDACSPSLSNVQPSLQGVKVPDENLTPRQRAHREEQLATIRKIQQMLLPESQNIEGGGTALSSESNIPPGPGPGSTQPTSSGSTMDWQKMPFFDDRKNKTGSGPVVPVGPVSSGNAPSVPMTSSVPGGTPGGGTASMLRGVTGPGPRLQGPPPPYHQTQRSASVPIALQSPNPTSPNNPTSNLSLPSPSRASSALNSPADSNRPFGLTRHMSTGQSPTSQDSPTAQRPNHSNPGTPLSAHHLSPSVTSSTTEPTSSHQSSVDASFGNRSRQSMAQQNQISTSTTTCSSTPTTGAVKEPNLMPVPSPQQIQYLTFEGQELIIQKQPNTSLKDRNMISPPGLSTTMDSGFPGTTDLPRTTVSGPNTPTSIDVGARFPSSSSEGCRFQIPSPRTPTAAPAGDKAPPRLSGTTGASGLSPQTVSGPSSDSIKSELFPTPSPHMMEVPRFQGPTASPGAKMGGGFVNVSSQGKPLDMPNYGCGRGDNIPLNPNCTSAMSGNPKVSHFDPISSLAQMSQQLTNSVASSLNGQGNQGPPMMNFGSPSMHMMDMGGCHGMGDMDQGSAMMGMPMQGHPPGFSSNPPMGPIRSLSPKLPGAFPHHMPMPRMMGRPPGPNPYNGANVQVKPNAPNTIQYLPSKSQVGQAPGPRGPPSLDFLTRLATPMNVMDSKMQPQNMQYFPSCGPNNGPMQGGPIPPPMSHMDNSMAQDGGMSPMNIGPPMGNGAGPMGPMGGSMGMPPGGMMPMMRGPMRPPMGMRMPQMMFNGPPGGPGVPESMFNPGPNMGNPSAQMFVSGPKGSPIGMGAPDASQPLPPSMGQNNSFKNSPFVGPTTADPNYAQQFHNFQQQLYATSTRSQMGGQMMGPGPGPPHMQQPPYFNPK